MADEQAPTLEFSIDRSNLYREELFTDLKVGSIRRMTPVKPDGTGDKTRRILYFGQTQVMTPSGPIPVQSIIKAKDLQQAFKQFPEAMQAAVEQMVEELKKMQQQQQQEDASRIIVPGR